MTVILVDSHGVRHERTYRTAAVITWCGLYVSGILGLATSFPLAAVDDPFPTCLWCVANRIAWEGGRKPA